MGFWFAAENEISEATVLADVSSAGAQLLTTDPEKTPVKAPAEYLYIPGMKPVMLGAYPTSVEVSTTCTAACREHLLDVSQTPLLGL